MFEILAAIKNVFAKGHSEITSEELTRIQNKKERENVFETTKKNPSTSKDTGIKITKFGNYGGFVKVILKQCSLPPYVGIIWFEYILAFCNH